MKNGFKITALLAVPFLWLILTSQIQPDIVKLQFTWISIMLFIILIIFILWIFLRLKGKDLTTKKSARLK